MESLSKLVKDLAEINKVLLATYGKNGKSALIQSTNKETDIKSFMATNDGIIHFFYGIISKICLRSNKKKFLRCDKFKTSDKF